MKMIHRLWPLVGVALVVGAAEGAAAPGSPHRAMVGMRPGADVATRADRHQLRQEMRKLWTDHVVWTREYIVAALDAAPDTKAAAARLMKNQEDIGNAIAAFYGRAAGDKLTALLKDHILIAVDVVADAKAGKQANLAAARARWKQNAEDIAAFLSRANPAWRQAALSDMMAMHLETTTREVVARLNGRWDEDVAAFDEVYRHILGMADALADGIATQFAAPAPSPSGSR